MIELVENLYKFLLYVIPWYLFLEIFSFCTLRKYDFTHKIVSSVIVSWILLLLFNAVNGVLLAIAGKAILSEAGYYIGVMLFSTGTAYLCSVITWAKGFDEWLRKLGVQSTAKSEFWNDVIDPLGLIKLYHRDVDRVYTGKFKYIQAHAEKPMIALRRCVIRDRDGNIIVDYNDQPNRLVLIDATDCYRIDVISQSKNIPPKQQS